MIRFVLRGFSVEITFLFVVTVVFCLISDQTGIAAMALFACFLHECGHLLAFCLTGHMPRALIFELTGIRLVPPVSYPGFLGALFIQSAGILVNLTMAVLCRALSQETAAAVHLLLGLFNALPLSTLDGGQILLLLLTKWFPVKGASVCTAVDGICTALLCVGCILMFLNDRGNLTLLIFSGGLLSALAGGIFGKRKHRRAKAHRGV